MALNKPAGVRRTQSIRVGLLTLECDRSHRFAPYSGIDRVCNKDIVFSCDEAWIDAVASAIGNQKAVIVLEPDALALLPSDCGYPAQNTTDRYTQINYAVSKLEPNPATIVYLDAGHSAWHSVGDMAVRLVQGGVLQSQGFYSNASNYRASNYETKFDTWISKCIAFANDPKKAAGIKATMTGVPASTTLPSAPWTQTTSLPGALPMIGTTPTWAQPFPPPIFSSILVATVRVP